MRIIFGFILLILFGCTSPEHHEASTEPSKTRTVLFVSDDGSTDFYLTVHGTASVELQVGDDPEVLHLVRVMAASGEKYETEDGIFFWNKGRTFMYGKGDSLLFSGSEPVE